MLYSEEIQNLIDEFSQFPGVGPKTAQRFVFYLLSKNSSQVDRFIYNLKKIKNIHCCSICHNFSNEKICPICQDQKRNHQIITVVSEPQDLIAIEKTKDYNGVYHVLGGVINTTHGTVSDNLQIKSLINRLKKSKVKEVIFALSSTIEGESTTMYISDMIKQDPQLKVQVKLTKIARGLPLGGEIEYADEITLSEALKGRKII